MYKGREHREAIMQEKATFDRREFLKGATIGTASIMGLASQFDMGAALADEAPVDGGSVDNTYDGMTLEELNEFRHALVDAQTDYTCEDGTVIPAVYVKMRALYNSYSFGMGSQLHDHCFDQFIYLYTEDEAQAYLEMPYGVRFTATDFAVESGRDEDECAALCEDLAQRAILGRALRGGVPYYWHLAHAYGMWEYRICIDDSEELPTVLANVWGDDSPDNKMGTGTPFYYSLPAGAEVVAEEAIYPYDDVLKMVERNEIFAVLPCQCQKLFGALGALDPEAQESVEIERCLVFGENAEYCIQAGGARQITREECLEILQRCKDEGMVHQTVWTKQPDVICNCHRDICGILSTYRALGEDMAQYNTCENMSHYDFLYDRDACIQCGACMQRCPVECITMDDEGYPQRNSACVRCGQCALVCPMQARKLTLRDLTDVTPLSDTLLDDYNLKAAFRVNHGMLTLD